MQVKWTYFISQSHLAKTNRSCSFGRISRRVLINCFLDVQKIEIHPYHVYQSEVAKATQFISHICNNMYLLLSPEILICVLKQKLRIPSRWVRPFLAGRFFALVAFRATMLATTKNTANKSFLWHLSDNRSCFIQYIRRNRHQDLRDGISSTLLVYLKRNCSLNHEKLLLEAEHDVYSVHVA